MSHGWTFHRSTDIRGRYHIVEIDVHGLYNCLQQYWKSDWHNTENDNYVCTIES